MVNNLLFYLIMFQYPGMDFSKAQLQKSYDTVPGLGDTS